MDKPIGDFLSIEPDRFFENNNPFFGASNAKSVAVHASRRVIPEPAEYALVFGLFALGFVFFRHFRKKPSTKIDL